MADRIFSHREDDSVQAEEEKLESVEQDHAEPFPSAQSVAVVTPIYRGEEELSGAPADAGAESDDLEIEEEAEETLPVVEDLAPEIEEALENAAGGEVVPTDADSDTPVTQPAAEGDAPAVQTAMVRDQNNRSLHRVSRRMRRRRGGNRFGPGQAGGSGASVASGAGSAAAPALESQAKVDSPREAVEEHTADRPERVMPSISELLKPGQEIIVQIAKEPLGQKGARITSHIALPGRYVVYMPSVAHLGVSRKVGSEEERMRLKRILQAKRQGPVGVDKGLG
jgi:ribonuclease G